MPLPAPPIKTMTDFVVFGFVSIVLCGLIAGWAIVVILYITDKDPNPLTNALLDITTTMVGALIGFIAGKGTGRAEVHDEQAAAKSGEP